MNTQEGWDNYFIEHNDDHAANLIYADWLEDQGHTELAIGYRILAKKKLRPDGAWSISEFLDEEWTWYRRTGFTGSALDVDPESNLSTVVYMRLKGGRKDVEGGWVDYDTRREAMDDAAMALYEQERVNAKRRKFAEG